MSYSDTFSHVSGATVSMRRAIRLFETLADMKDLAFNHGHDGCHARAHLMCDYLLSKGVAAKKAWVFHPQKGGYFHVSLPAMNTLWEYHVAAAVDVQFNNAVVPVVLDPSIFDGPALLEEWCDVIGADAAYAQVLPWKKVPAGMHGNYKPDTMTGEDTSAQARKELGGYRIAAGRDGQREVVASKLLSEYAKANALPVKEHGATWKTAPAG